MRNTTDLLEWPKSETLTIIILIKVWNRNSHSFLVGMENVTETLEDRLAVSDKTKYTLTI